MRERLRRQVLRGAALALLGAGAASGSVGVSQSTPGAPGALGASGTSATSGIGVLFWVRTEAEADHFPTLLATKDWDGGEIEDRTSHHELGLTRTSGGEVGWAVALQPNGSWAWNLGDGTSRHDYQPTVERQPVNDGRWHLLGFSIDDGAQEARLFHDGREVAVYSLHGLGGWRTETVPDLPPVEFATIEDLTVIDRPLRRAEVASAWATRGNAVVEEGLLTEPLAELTVLAWNIWHGGRRDGDEIGLDRTVEIIESSGADVVCMQETYGSGARIADALGYHFYLRSSNLSVMSRFPIRATHDLFEPFRFGGVTLELAPEQEVKVFSLWIHYLPDYAAALRDGATTEALVAADEETRGAEIRAILAALEPTITESEPVIVAGDFNSPSHLDWTEAAREQHMGLVVPWPVSTAMAAAGFVDVFRAVHADPRAEPGRTWSPRFTDAWQDRIDYVYFRGAGIEPRTARIS